MQKNLFERTPEEEIDIFFQQLEKVSGEELSYHYLIICNAKNISFLYHRPLFSEKSIFTKDFKINRDGSDYTEVKANSKDGIDFIVKCIKENYFVELIKIPRGASNFLLKEQRLYPLD